MNKGDFIKIEFIGKVKDTGEVFDLTDEKLAKEKGVYDKSHSYGPSLAIVGAGSLIPGVEKTLESMKVGEEREFDVPYKDAFGARRGDFVKVFSINKFYEQKMNPIPGTYVNIDGMNCRVQTVSGGRVRVDFNHPLANKDLHYWIKIVEQITDDKKKVEELLNSYKIEGSVSVEGKKATLDLKIKNLQINKLIEDSIKKWTELEVSFTEAKKTEPGKKKP